MRIRLPCCLTVLFASASTTAKTTAGSERVANEETPSSYGLDVSFPIHYRVSTNYPWLPHNRSPERYKPEEQYADMPLQPLGDRQQAYIHHLESCREAYAESPNWCDHYENDRMIMNRRQPQSMMNYTETGFLKTRAPENVVKLVEDFWEKNQHHKKEEKWPAGNSYLNHWDSPTYLVSVDDKGLRGSGPELKEQIWAAAAATLETWTSQELQPCSLYGIRVYSEGAVMLPHVDRLPLVASAMINVAQDVDEPWPFEMYDHAGKAHNVTLEPGDMLLFESHSVIHGHPFPLKGRSYAMIFLHFEPTGHALKYDSKLGFRRVQKEYVNSVKAGVGGQSSAAGGGSLPPYIKRESPEEENWRKLHPKGWSPPYETLSSDAHAAAMQGDVKRLKEELDKDQSVLTERDENGWQVLHQGAASGNEDVVQLLVNRGAEINARTHGGYGETPLRIAEKRHGSSHPIVRYLKSIGALSLGPEL